MKILCLRLANLASIAGEHCIEFEQEPLKNAGLIAITGITGAGKTTLLDAICLALFDQMPRLHKAEGKLTDSSGHEVQIDSSVNILRRGCAQGFAEVEFIAQDQKHYLARWEVKRARLKADGRIQPVLRALRCLSDDQLISERTKECNEKISLLLGLSFSQFTRAVLLAQSEVTAFLKAKDHERADLLEYLTNSDIYSRIGIASFNETKKADEQVKQIELRMGGQQPLTDDERDQLLHELNDLQQQLSQQQQLCQQLEKGLDWYAQQAQLEQHLAQQQLQLANCQSQLQQFQPQRDTLAQLEQLEPVRAPLLEQQRLKQQHDELLQQQADCRQQQHTIQQQLDQHQRQHALQQQQLAALQQRQQLIKPQLKIAQQYEHELANTASQLQQAQDKLQQVQAVLLPKQQALQTLQQQHTRLDTQQQQQQQVLAGIEAFALFDAEPQAALQVLQKAATLRHKLSSQQPELLLQPSSVQQQHIHAIRSQLDGFVDQHGTLIQLEQQVQLLQQQLEQQKNHQHKCELVKQKIQRWAHTEQQLAQLAQQQASSQQQFTQAQFALQQAEQQRITAELQLKTTQQLLTEQRLFTAQSAVELRQQLKPDQPCMVCGSTEHPFYQSEQLLHALNKQLDAQQQQAEHALQQALQQERALQQSSTQQQTRLDQLLIRHNQLQQERQDTLHEIATLSSKFYQRLLPQPELAMAQQTLQGIQEKLTQTTQTLEQQIQQQHSQLKTWQQLEKQLEQQQNLLEKYHELTAFEQQVIAVLEPKQQQDWQHDCMAAHAQFAQSIQQRCDAIALLKQIEAHRQQLQQQSIPLQADINHLTAQQHELQQQIDQHTSQQQQRQQQLKQVFAEHAAPWIVNSCQHWIEQLDQHLQQQHIQLQQADQLRQHTEKQHSRLQQQHEYITAEIQKNQQHSVQQQMVIEQWQQQHTQFSPAHILQLLAIDHVHKQQLQTEFQRLQQHLHQAENSLSIFQNQLSQHALHQPATSIELLQQTLHDTRQQLKQLDEHCTHLKLKKLQDEQQQQQAAQHQVALNKAKAEHHRWSKISSLIGDAKGVTFKKLAQQFHLQMLVELANQQLSALTPRYALRCIEDSLGLTIVDHYMNDEVRPVVSLSGGESFLVSLALALGIANMASGTTKLESLFIDEGFGTLDQSSLHVVMDALDRLQSQGRKVILISHIQEMHERIPVKIQVLPQGSGASKIEVVG